MALPKKLQHQQQMQVTLEYVYGSNHFERTTFDAYGWTADKLRRELSTRFDIPYESIYLYRKKPVNIDDTHEIVLDSSVPDHEIIGAGDWYWTNVAEEPGNWEMKKKRALSFIRTSIKQIELDMKMCTFGLYKYAELYYTTHNAAPDLAHLLRVWNSLSDRDDSDLKHYVDWIRIVNETDWEEFYREYYSRDERIIIIQLYGMLHEKLKLLNRDLHLLKENLKAIVGNDARLMAVMRMEFSKTVTSFSLKSPFKNLKRSAAGDRILDEERLALEKVSLESSFNATQTSLGMNFHAIHYEVQKVSGMYAALKEERCQVKLQIEQLYTHRKLFALRGKFLWLLQRIPDVPFTPPSDGDFSVEKWKYKFQVMREEMTASQLCLISCCESSSSSGIFIPPIPIPSPSPQSKTSFIKEFKAKYSTLSPSEKAALFGDSPTFQLPSVAPTSMYNPTESFIWRSSSKLPVVLAIKENGIYLIATRQGLIKKQLNINVFQNDPKAPLLSELLKKLLDYWESAGLLESRAEFYMRDTAPPAAAIPPKLSYDSPMAVVKKVRK